MQATYSVDKVEDQAHGNAEFLKVQVAIVVDIGEVPNLLELVVAQLAVLEHGGGLLAIQVRAALGQGGEDLPVALNLPLLYPLCSRHGGVVGRWWGVVVIDCGWCGGAEVHLDTPGGLSCQAMRCPMR